VRLGFAGDAELDEPIEPGLAGRFEDVGLDVGEAEERGEAAPRDAPVRSLALPVGDPEPLGRWTGAGVTAA
jgi:hypothetical protein